MSATPVTTREDLLGQSKSVAAFGQRLKFGRCRRAGHEHRDAGRVDRRQNRREGLGVGQVGDLDLVVLGVGRVRGRRHDNQAQGHHESRHSSMHRIPR